MSTATAGLLVSIADIADLAGVTRSAVSNWRKRANDFPLEVAATSGTPRFDVAEVEAWLIEKGKIDGLIPRRRLVEPSLWAFADEQRTQGITSEQVLRTIASILLAVELADIDHLSSLLSSKNEGTPILEIIGPVLTGISDERPYLKQLVGAARETLAGSDFGAAAGSLIAALVGAKQQDPDSTEAVLDLAVERLLPRSEHGPTPSNLAHLMMRLAPEGATAIIDPAAGLGASLMIASDAHPNAALTAVEVNDWACDLLRARVDLRGRVATAEHASAFSTMTELRGTADLVVCDPPMGVESWSSVDLYRALNWTLEPPSPKAGNSAWLQLSHELLSGHGTAIVVTPQSLLFTAIDQRLRQALLALGAIESVISLPRKILSTTTLAPSLVILRKQGNPEQPVLMIDATSLGQRGRQAHTFSDQDIDRIAAVVDLHRAGEQPTDDIAWVVNPDAIAAPDFDLSPSRYRPRAVLDRIELDARVAELVKAVEAHGEQLAHTLTAATGTVDQTTDQSPGLATHVQLRDLASIHRGFTPAKPTDAGEPLFGIAEIGTAGEGEVRYVAPDEKMVNLKTDDIVIGLLGRIGEAALVPERHDGSVLGRECVALRIESDAVTPEWVLAWTQTEDFRAQVQRSTSGTTMPRLSAKRLGDFELPVPELDFQREASEHVANFAAASASVAQLSASLSELERLQNQLTFLDLAEAE